MSKIGWIRGIILSCSVVAVVLAAPTLDAEPSLPGCPDPEFDDEGFFPCPCPACMAPCQFPAEPQGECKGPDGSASESTFTCCCCGGAGNLFRPFTPALDVEPVAGGALLYWTDIPNAETYDVVSGDLDALRAGGNFGQATSGCDADDDPGATLFVETAPDPGACVWFLVRGDGGGSYDSASGSQMAPRDAAIAASGNDCD